MSKDYIAIDIETTGLDYHVDRIVELGAIRFDESGREIDRYQTLINPECDMSGEVISIHGIQNEQVKIERVIKDVFGEFLPYILHNKESLMLAHNSKFDAGFIRYELIRCGIPLGFENETKSIYDTLDLARKKYKGAVNHKLGTLAEIVQSRSDGLHRALADCNHVKNLWVAMSGPSYPVEMLRGFRLYYPDKLPIGE